MNFIRFQLLSNLKKTIKSNTTHWAVFLNPGVFQPCFKPLFIISPCKCNALKRILVKLMYIVLKLDYL